MINNERPNSISVEDVFFGDSGKGSVVAKFNHLLSRKWDVVSLRYNGGANAGHETLLYGKSIVTHQLPMGVIQEGVTAIISRGMLIHPEDLVTEIADVETTLGSKLPGKLVIDERVPLGLDTHRALETALNRQSDGGKGSTGRGISPGYASVYERVAVTAKDLFSDNWKEVFRTHYALYAKLVAGLTPYLSLQI
jgi:adenylosuccinate synthase